MKFTRLLLCITILAFCSSTSIKAQSLDLGIKAGANFSSLSNAKSLDLSTRTGLSAGFFVAARFNMLSVQGELLYSQQGADASFGNLDLDYVQIPVFAKLHFLRVLNLQLGPQFGYLMNYDDFENSNKVDMSLLVGAGAHLGKFRIDARYNFGLSNPFNDESVLGNDEPKNAFFSLAIGYSFL